MRIETATCRFLLHVGRGIVKEVEDSRQREAEARDQLLKERVDTANLDVLRNKIQMDFDLLRPVAPSSQRDAVEAALDLVYLKDRQQHLVY